MTNNKNRINYKRPIYCVELDWTFETLKEAAEELELNKTSICNCCRGRQQSTGGFHFTYAEEHGGNEDE